MDFKTIDIFSAILTYLTKATIKNAKKWAIMRFYIISSYGENLSEAVLLRRFWRENVKFCNRGDFQFLTIWKLFDQIFNIIPFFTSENLLDK